MTTKDHPVLLWLQRNKHEQAWLAEKANVSRPTLCKMLKGRQVPVGGVLLRIERVTGVTCSAMLAWAQERRGGSEASAPRCAVRPKGRTG